MKPTNLIAIALVTAGLAGCFTADEPLLSDADSVAPYEKITFQEKDSGDGSTLTRQGTAYVAEDLHLTMRFMALDRPNWYVAEATGESDGEVERVYAMVKVDLANHLAETYVAVAGDGDTGPGLTRCRDQMVCVANVDAYVAHAEAAIDAGAEPVATYDITVE